MVVATIKRRVFPEGIYVLSKECSPFFIPNSFLIEFSIPFFKEGYEVDESLYNKLREVNDCYLCRKKAVDLLARRDHSVFELKTKLKVRNFLDSSIENAIEYVIEKKYLNENRYCENLINKRLVRGEGKYLILQRLNQKGISSSLASQVYEQVVDIEKEKEACLISLNKVMQKYEDIDVVKSKILKKGFSNYILKRCLEDIN